VPPEITQRSELPNDFRQLASGAPQPLGRLYGFTEHHGALQVAG